MEEGGEVEVEVEDKFLKNYAPHVQNAIDEAMIPYKGIYIHTKTKK